MEFSRRDILRLSTGALLGAGLPAEVGMDATHMEPFLRSCNTNEIAFPTITCPSVQTELYGMGLQELKSHTIESACTTFIKVESVKRKEYLKKAEILDLTPPELTQQEAQAELLEVCCSEIWHRANINPVSVFEEEIHTVVIQEGASSDIEVLLKMKNHKSVNTKIFRECFMMALNSQLDVRTNGWPLPLNEEFIVEISNNLRTEQSPLMEEWKMHLQDIAKSRLLACTKVLKSIELHRQATVENLQNQTSAQRPAAVIITRSINNVLERLAGQIAYVAQRKDKDVAEDKKE